MPEADGVFSINFILTEFLRSLLYPFEKILF